jgi:chloride channel protein, CIC family
MTLRISSGLQKFINQLLIWRIKNISDKQFIIFLSVLVGILGGLSSVLIKNLVHLIRFLLIHNLAVPTHSYLLFVFPIIGILLVTILLRYILKREPEAEISDVLYALSRNEGKMKPHNVYTTVLASSITVGFGGSVGLEGPSVTTSLRSDRFFRNCCDCPISTQTC